MPTIAERFAKFFTPGAPDRCWEWTGTISAGGYGWFWANGRAGPAHRIAYELANALPPDGRAVVRHKCDNKRCVNPGHLIEGTQLDNVQDRVDRNRSAIGSRVGASKLTEDQVAEIRKCYIPRVVTHQDLADRYGVSKRTIFDVLRRKYWRHVS